MTPEVGTLRSALAHRELRWYLLHHAVAGTAQSLGTVAVAVSLYAQTHSIIWVAAAAAARLVPYLLLSGRAAALAGRVNLRHLLLWSAGLRAVALAMVAVAVRADAHALIIVGLVFAATTIGIPCYPALAALVPSVVPTEDLAPANGLLSSIETTSWMIGPAAGGLLLLGGNPAAALTANAAFFAIGVLALVPTSARTLGVLRPDPRPAVWPALLDGARTVLGSTEIAFPLLLVVAVNLVLGGATVGLLLVAADLLHSGQAGFSLLVAALGFGGLAGVAVTHRVAASARPDLGILAGTVVAGAPFAALALVTSPWLAMALVLLAGSGAVVAEVVAMTLLLRYLRPQMTTRVFGRTDALLIGSALLGVLIAPALISATGVRTSLLVFGAVLPLIAAAGARQWQRLAACATPGQTDLDFRVDLLAGQPWLTYALPTVLETLAHHAVEEEVPAGTVLIRQGDVAEDFYLILDGEFEVTEAAAERGSRVVYRLGPRQGFGEIGLLGDAARTATVTAGWRRIPKACSSRLRTDCRTARRPAHVLRLSGDVFVAAVNSAPMAAYGSIGASLIARMAAGVVAQGCGAGTVLPDGRAARATASPAGSAS